MTVRSLKRLFFSQPFAVMVPSWEWWCAVHPVEGDVLLMVSHHSFTVASRLSSIFRMFTLSVRCSICIFPSVPDYRMEGKFPIMQQASLAFIKLGDLCAYITTVWFCWGIQSHFESFHSVNHDVISWYHGYGSVDTITLWSFTGRFASHSFARSTMLHKVDGEWLLS